MRRIKDIDCIHDKYIKINNKYICVKCNRKFNKEELDKIKKGNNYVR